jgi:TonB-linked SusC/RagA family outer membrane protein
MGNRSILHAAGRLSVSLLIPLLLLGVTDVHAQTATITGRVTSAESGQPLPEAQVSVVGTSLGGLTNAEGRYTITGVPLGTVEVRAQYIGYETASQAVTLTADEPNVVNFQLGVGAISLEGVVITATGPQRKREVGTAVATINATEMVSKSAPTDVAALIQGNATGVTVSSSSGTVGNATNMRIRGNTSINLDNTPLVYVDGARISTDARDRSTGGAASDRMLDINPDDIQSIEIVKGPAAATLYGTQAAAGVIRITTKRGAAGRGRITVKTEYGVSWDPHDYPKRGWNPFMDLGPQYADTTYFIDSLKGSIDHPDSDLYYNPFRNGRHQKVTASVSGGSEQFGYFLSADYTDQDGVFVTNGQRAYNVRGNFNFKPTERLDVQFSNGFTSSNTAFNYNDGESWGFVGAPLLASPMWAPIMRTDPNGGGDRIMTCPRAFEEARLTGQPLAELTEMCDFDNTFSGRNNFARLKTMANELAVERYVGSGTLTWTPTEYLVSRATVGYDSYGERGFDMIPNHPLKIRDADPQRALSHVTGRILTVEGTTALRIGLTDNLASETTVGAQFYSSETRITSATGFNFPPGAETVGNSATTSGGEDYLAVRTLGLFLQQQLSWKDRLFITPGFRYDDNSAFGENLGAVIYPKISASWVISEEPWFPQFTDDLRLRGAWGKAGKQPGPYDAVTRLAATSVTLPDGSSASGFEPRRQGNDNLEPETGVELELGFDASFLRSRLGLDFTYFDKTTRNALVLRPVPPSVGFPEGVWSNVGEVVNKGIEAAVNGTVLETDKVSWNLRVAYTRLKSEITKLDAPIAIGGRGLQEHRQGYPFGAYFMRPVVFDASGNVVVEDEPVFVGQPTPKYDGSLSSTLSLFGNRLNLYGQLSFVGGHKTVNYTEVYLCRTAFHTCEAKYDRDANGQQTDMARLKSDPAANQQAYHFTYDADFARLRTLSLQYILPPSWTRRLGAETGSVSVVGNNLFLWTKYPGTDPEINSQGRQNASQREFFSAGQTQGVTFSLSLSF